MNLFLSLSKTVFSLPLSLSLSLSFSLSQKRLTVCPMKEVSITMFQNICQIIFLPGFIFYKKIRKNLFVQICLAVLIYTDFRSDIQIFFFYTFNLYSKINPTKTGFFDGSFFWGGVSLTLPSPFIFQEGLI